MKTGTGDLATLAARQRRATLEIRTLTVTLRTALDDLDRDPLMSPPERTALRRAWCERVSVLIQDVRARSMQTERLCGAVDAWQQRRSAEVLERADAELARLRDAVA